MSTTDVRVGVLPPWAAAAGEATDYRYGAQRQRYPRHCPSLKDQQGYSAERVKKKEGVIEPVNTALLRHVKPDDITVDIYKVDEAEVDEMWSFVGTKKAPRWLWHAIAGLTL
jgi:hypothetical protein